MSISIHESKRSEVFSLLSIALSILIGLSKEKMMYLLAQGCSIEWLENNF